MLKHKKLTVTWLLFAVCFYGVWAISEIWLSPLLKQAVPNEYLFLLLWDGLIKNILWTLPAFLLIRHFSKELVFSCKELFSLRKEHLKYLLIAVFLTIFVVGGAIVRRHGFSLSPDFHPSQLIIVLFVGLSEEIVFRGFFLNTTLIGTKTPVQQGVAVGINALMFLAIHFPIWISEGIFLSSFTSFGFVTVLALSALFSYCTIKTRSLWIAVILHSFYDALVFLFV